MEVFVHGYSLEHFGATAEANSDGQECSRIGTKKEIWKKDKKKENFTLNLRPIRRN
jgi:hypothetical protein